MQRVVGYPCCSIIKHARHTSNNFTTLSLLNTSSPVLLVSAQLSACTSTSSYSGKDTKPEKPVERVYGQRAPSSSQRVASPHSKLFSRVHTISDAATGCSTHRRFGTHLRNCPLPDLDPKPLIDGRRRLDSFTPTSCPCGRKERRRILSRVTRRRQRRAQQQTQNASSSFSGIFDRPAKAIRMIKNRIRQVTVGLGNGSHKTDAKAEHSKEKKADCVCVDVMDEIYDTDCMAASSRCPQFTPKKVLVLTKLTRLDFERRTNTTCSSEEELKQLLLSRGSDYNHLLERHDYHNQYLQVVTNELAKHGIEYRVVHRFDYTDESVAWADAIFTAGGDGTFLLAASRVFDPCKPLIGINTDPIGSEGYMCLMNKLSYEYLPSALARLLSGDFEWTWRQRIRITMFGPDAWSDPIELHNQQLLFPEHRWLDHIREAEDSCQRHASVSGSSNIGTPPLSRSSSSRRPPASTPAASANGYMSSGATPRILPYLALNEVFMGESVSSRVSYFEAKFDDEPATKQKNSGITVCTGTGSTSWYFNINRMSQDCVRNVLKIINEETLSKIDATDDALIDRICSRFNDQLLFSPSKLRMAYAIRDPVSNATFKCDKPRGFCDRAEIKSRCFDAHLVVDGGMSYAFNNGTRCILEIRPRDALRTVIFR